MDVDAGLGLMYL